MSSSSVNGEDGISSSSDINGDGSSSDVGSSSSSDVNSDSSSSDANGDSSSSDIGGNSSSSDVNSDSSSSSEEVSVWLISKLKGYIVSDAISMNYTYTYTYTSYIDNKHYEQRYNYTSNSDGIFGSGQASGTGSTYRNGNTLQDARIIDTDITTTSQTVYDEESGLMLSYTTNSTQTINGEPYNSSIELNSTIILLSTEGDVKTYKRYQTNTGGTGAYNEYKVQNGVTLEEKSYTAEGALSCTYIYTLPGDATIRAKIPTFRIYSKTCEASPEENRYQICEVVSDSATKLTIRETTYNTATGALTEQFERTYVKH